MSINAATSSSTSQAGSTTSSSQVNSASNSDSAKKSSTDSSFKDEMNKVSSSEDKKDTKGVEKSDTKVEAISDKTENDAAGQNNADTNNYLQAANFNAALETSMSILQNDIEQMASREATPTTPTTVGVDLSVLTDKSNKPLTASISMTQSDAEFFVNLTQNNDVSLQNATAQAQNLINQGADAKEVKQNVQISETLLNAINTAKENNQPLRIDFDQNVSVVLRVSKDGVISANFIPGDKAVEQYLRNNIDSLKATFNENDLPYAELSYSNRGKQQQKENRKNKQ